MKINYDINSELLNLIKKQLGRSPDNLLGIARYCPFGSPAVLVVKPYSKKGIVFPTTYWLSCPYLVKEVYDPNKNQKIVDKIYLSHFNFKPFVKKEEEKSFLFSYTGLFAYPGG